MIRKEAMEIIVNEIGDEPIISANGYISRDLFNVKDKPSNFYMIGSMGLASSIGLGVALKNSRKKIFRESKIFLTFAYTDYTYLRIILILKFV